MWKARLSELTFDDAELSGVLEALDSEWITAGPRTQAFEKAFAEFVGVPEAVAVSNGTAALFLALKALNIGPGDEVLCPSLTFVATAAAVLHCGATPVFVDIESLEVPTMDPEDAARKLTWRTKALLPVHYAGIPADMQSIAKLAASHNLALVEDAAHSPGASFDRRPCGAWGAAGCFSFFANKNMTTAEGGAITTADPELAERLRRLRSHGMTVTSWDREKGRPAHYDVLEIGYNFRFDDIRAALGLAQFAKLPRINQRRAELAARYTAGFLESGIEVGLPFRNLPEVRHAVHHIYPIVCRSQEQRDHVAQQLQQCGIQTSLHYTPVHLFTAFQNGRSDNTALHLGRTEDFSSRELTLPLYPSLTDDQVDLIVAAVVGCYERELLHHHPMPERSETSAPAAGRR